MTSLAQPAMESTTPETTGELEAGFEITQAGLEGQGIIPVKEVTLSGGLAVYKVDRALTDGTLEEVLENGSVGTIEAVELTLGALKVVEEMKHQGLIAHGDISPRNVLADREHHTGAISGFHNARAGEGTLSVMGFRPVIIGDEGEVHPEDLNDSFTAPEILAGGLPDSRSDVYEAGRTLLYALHGKRLMPTVEYDAFMDMMQPVPPPELSGDFPSDTPNAIRFAVQKALDPRPDNRQTMSQLISAVGAELVSLKAAA